MMGSSWASGAWAEDTWAPASWADALIDTAVRYLVIPYRRAWSSFRH